MKHSKTLSNREIFSNPLYFIAFGFGTGLLPWAQGTFGTLIAIPLYLLLSFFSLPIYFLIVLVITVFGIWLCGYASKKIGIHDYTPINFDEVVGFLWIMFAVPRQWYWILIAFVLFRIFDIWKPWPIKYVDEKVQGGFGMVVDDLLAALYGWIILQLLIKIF